MKQGKLSNQQLHDTILNKLNPQNSEILLGAGVGEDCCAVDLGDICVVSTDPITAADANAGMLAIHINANDIASAGARPIAALVTLLVPVHTTQEQLDDVVQQLTYTAKELSIDIIGGHTEVTDSVRRLVVSVTMIGKPVTQGKVFKTADMRVGDDIILTKYAGMEGTAILAEDFSTELNSILNEQDNSEIALVKGSISVVPEGVAAAKMDGVSAMHDITEGGVKGALAEMAEASGTGVAISFGEIPVLPVTKKICAHYGLDVYSLISSGSMLITARDGAAVIRGLERLHIPAKRIGRVTDAGLIDADTQKPFRAQQTDELYKVLEKTR